MPEAWSVLLVVAVASAVLLYGFSKTAMPVAGMVAGPLLAAALTPAVASGFMVPLLIVGDLIALSRYRQHADWRLIGRLVPGVLAGFVIAAAAFRFLDRSQLSRLLGVLILISVLLEVRRLRQGGVPPDSDSRLKRWLSLAFYGTLAGTTTMAANAGGAAMTLYLVKSRVSMLAFMGTSAWFFFIVNLAKLPLIVPLGLVTRESVLIDVWFLPALLVGAALGVFAFKRMSQTVFTNAALILSAAAAAWLLIHG